MAEIGTNVILDGISLALKATFPESSVYTGKVAQGLNDGDFIVNALTSTSDPLLGGRRRSYPRFDVIYFPIGGNTDAYAVSDRLGAVLRTIALPGGDYIHGTELSATYADDELHVFVSYPYNTAAPQSSQDRFEALTINQEVKSGS